MNKIFSSILISISIFFSAGTALACGPINSPNACGVSIIGRNLQYISFPNQSDTYAYFLADYLSSASFYLAYKKEQGVSLSSADLEKVNNYIKYGYYEGSGDSFSNRGTDSYDLALKTIEQRKKTFSQDDIAHLEENYGKIPKLENVYPSTGESYVTDCNNVNLQSGEILFSSDGSKLMEGETQGSAPTSIVQDSKQLNFFEKIWQSIVDFFKKIISSMFGSAAKASLVSLGNDSVYRIFNYEGSKEFKYDQDYQNAIYYFYRARFVNDCDYQNSKKLFNKIMQDSNSPWYSYAYLGYARVLAREAALYNNKLSFDEDSSKDNEWYYWWRNNINNHSEIEKKYTEALNLIDSYVARDDLASIRDDLLFQRQRILLYLLNDKEFIKADQIISSKNAEDQLYYLSVFDGQINLLGKIDGRDGMQTAEEDLKRFNVDSHSEFGQYMYYWNFADNSSQTIEKIKQAYEKSSQKYLWLTLLLRKVGLSDNHMIEQAYIDTALSINGNSQLYYPLHYYADKINYANNVTSTDNDTIKILDSTKTPDVAYNYFADLTLVNSKNLSKSLSYAFKKVSFVFNQESGAGYHVDMPGEGLCKDCEGKLLLSNGNLTKAIEKEVPISLIYSNSLFKKYQQKTLLFNSLILNRADIYRPLNEDLSNQANGELYKNALNLSSNPSKEKFLILYAILKSDNECYIHSENNCSSGDWSTKESFFSNVLTEEQKKEKANENKILEGSTVGSFAQIIFDYQKNSPNDERIPEALHLLNFYNRSCWYETRDRAWSKKVFDFLHDNYPNSSWTEKTPYYY